MKVVMFYHSLVSDWNHGNAHFLRGIASELLAAGHEVEVFEPSDSWSRCNLIEKFGTDPISRFEESYPELESHIYDSSHFYPEAAIRDADLVIVHEWNTPELVSQIGRLRQKLPFVLLFHDTHHRMVTEPAVMARYDLSNYDGVLAYGRVLRDLYLSKGLSRRAWVWHEAADVRRFHPKPGTPQDGDLVWIGNWGDEERTAELHEYLIEPVRALGLRAAVYGVRYPSAARVALARAGIEYRGWLPNFQVPDVFARFLLTIHVPRRPYAKALQGIPTIRPFEALACGIPLVSAPWDDVERLFREDEDLVFVRNGAEMQEEIRRLIDDPDARESLSKHGLETILARHTCAQRVRELMRICEEVQLEEFSNERVLSLTEP